jgi:hypothetical protein
MFANQPSTRQRVAAVCLAKFCCPINFPRNLGANFRLYIAERLDMTSQNEESKKARTTEKENSDYEKSAN